MKKVKGEEFWESANQVHPRDHGLGEVLTWAKRVVDGAEVQLDEEEEEMK